MHGAEAAEGLAETLGLEEGHRRPRRRSSEPLLLHDDGLDLLEPGALDLVDEDDAAGDVTLVVEAKGMPRMPLYSLVARTASRIAARSGFPTFLIASRMMFAAS